MVTKQSNINNAPPIAGDHRTPAHSPSLGSVGCAAQGGENRADERQKANKGEASQPTTSAMGGVCGKGRGGEAGYA